MSDQNHEEKIEVIVTTPERHTRRWPLSHVRAHAESFRECALELDRGDACLDPDGRYRGVDGVWHPGTIGDWLAELAARPPCPGEYHQASNLVSGTAGRLGAATTAIHRCCLEGGHEGPCKSSKGGEGYWVRRREVGR